MTIVGYFGNHVSVKGTVASEPRQFGFYKNGSWALSGGEGWKPSYRFGLREYRKKNNSIVKLEDVVAVEEGWN